MNRFRDSLLRLKVEAGSGSTIHRCTHQMVKLARQLNVVVECEFNACELFAYPEHISGDALAEAYNQAVQIWHDRGSPERFKPMAFSDGSHSP